MDIKTIRYIQIPQPQPNADMQSFRCIVPVILWEEPMRYSSLFKAGDEICEQGAWYKAIDVQVQDEIQVVTVEPIPVEPSQTGMLF